MPTSLDAHPSVDVVKMLLVGDSGAGKSGALASLVDAGYKLRILDFEAGLDPLVGHVKDKSLLANVSYETLKDEFKIIGSNMAVNKAASFQRALALLQNWEPFGAVQDWEDPHKTVLVVDTIGAMGRAALNMILKANNVLQPMGNRGGPETSHWGGGMDNIDRVLDNITNPALVPCHLIATAHIAYQEREGEGAIKAFPELLAKSQNPKAGRRFNNLISLSMTGGERSFKTQKDGLLMCKTSKPIQPKYKIETGLADIFRDLLS
jgi:hypothetical protein